MRLLVVLSALFCACTLAARPPQAPPVRPDIADVSEDPFDLRPEIARFFAAYAANRVKATPPIVKGAAVREEDGDHPKVPAAPAAPAPQYSAAGTKKLVDGYWYTMDGKGNGVWCESCNGCTFDAAMARYTAATRKAPEVAAPARPFVQPGDSRVPASIPTYAGFAVTSSGTVPTAGRGIRITGARSAGPALGRQLFASGSAGCATGGG
jgi:hypothetical protein